MPRPIEWRKKGSEARNEGKYTQKGVLLSWPQLYKQQLWSGLHGRSSREAGWCYHTLEWFVGRKKDRSANVFQSLLIGQIHSMGELTHLHLQDVLPGLLGRLLGKPDPLPFRVTLLLNLKAVGVTIAYVSLIVLVLCCEITAGMPKPSPRPGEAVAARGY